MVMELRGAHKGFVWQNLPDDLTGWGKVWQCLDMPTPGHDPDASKGDDALLSAAGAARKLHMSRRRFAQWAQAGIVAGVADPESGRTRYHMPTVRRQLDAAAKASTSVA